MTENTSTNSPIRLEISRVETIHVTSGENKIPSLCFVIKDSEHVDSLLNNPMPLPTMIITEVVPLKNDPTRAEIFFRNLTSEELAARQQQMFLPTGSIKEIFGDLLDVLGANGQESTPESGEPPSEDTPAVENPEVKPASEGDFEVPLGGVIEIISANGTGEDVLQQMVEKIRNFDDTLGGDVIASDNTNTYSVEVTLAEAHLALMLCLNSNAPAFVLTSETLYRPATSENVVVWEDFISVVEFPYVDTPDYFDATALLIQAVTGHFPLNITAEEISTYRAELLSLIVRIAAGSRPALVSAFGFINPLNRAKIHANNNQKPTKEDALNTFRADVINNLYRITNSRSLLTFLRGAPPAGGDIRDWVQVDRIFTDNGLNEMFQDILDKEYEQHSFSLHPNATVEEILGFYTTPLTRNTFPAGLKEISDRYIQMPRLFDHNWVGEQVEIETTETNVGEVLISKLIAVAVRFARMLEIAKQTGKEFIPLAVLLQGVMFPGESPVWAYTESIKSFIKGKDDEGLLFEMLSIAGFPEDYTNPQMFLGSSLVTLIHQFFHTIVGEWEYDVLEPSIKELPFFGELTSGIYANVADTPEDKVEEGACPIMIGIFNYLTANTPAPELLVHEFAQAIKITAELTLLRDTNFNQGTPEWDAAVNGYVQDMFGVN